MGFLDKLSDKITGANIPPPPPSNSWFEDEDDEQEQEKEREREKNKSAPRPPLPDEDSLAAREIPASSESYVSGNIFKVKFITTDDTDYGGIGKVDIEGTAQVRLTSSRMHRTEASSQIRQEMIAQSRRTMLNMREFGIPFDKLEEQSRMTAIAIMNRFESDDFELVKIDVTIKTSKNTAGDQ